jgi:hypothetical protein
MSSELKPAPQLFMMRQQTMLMRAIYDPRRTGYMTLAKASIKTIFMGLNKG